MSCRTRSTISLPSRGPIVMLALRHTLRQRIWPIQQPLSSLYNGYPRFYSPPSQSYSLDRRRQQRILINVPLPAPSICRQIAFPGVTGVRGIHWSAKLFEEAKSKQHVTTSSSEKDEGKPLLDQYEPQKLSEDILTIPNVLTILRLLSTPVLGYLIMIDQMQYALALLAISGFTDVLDGYLARKMHSSTVFGSIADPAADKALMTVMVGALAWRGLLPIPLLLLIVGRDVGLVISAFLIRWKSLPEPKTFQRYWNPKLPSAKVQPTQISKYNTFLQIILVAICTLLASLSDPWRKWWSEREGLWKDTSTLPPDEERRQVDIPSTTETQKRWGDRAKKAWHGFMVIVSATTVWSGASYMFGTGAVRYLGRQKGKVG